MNSAQSPVRHLDLATPAFYYYRKNPKCYHTVWGIYHKESRKHVVKYTSPMDPMGIARFSAFSI